MSQGHRTWGFRISATDVLVLLATPPLTWWWWSNGGDNGGDMSGIMPLAVGHFFLFCNVFRIHRTKELVWAAACLINVGAWAVLDSLWWPGVLLIQTPLTVTLILLEMHQPGYHGVWAKRINPHLQTYLEKIL